MGQHVRPFLLLEHGELALLRGASLSTGPPGQRYPAQHQPPIPACVSLFPICSSRPPPPRHAPVDVVANLAGRHV